MILLALIQIAGGSGLIGAPPYSGLRRGPPPREAAGMPTVTNHADCLALAERDPAAGAVAASRWRIAGGGWQARQCAGLAASAQGHWRDAAPLFEEAARDAAGEHVADARANLWAQAGNAWLAAGDPQAARTALDSALAAGSLKGLALGEAELDHARASVAAGDLAVARADIDLALRNAPEDPLAWLLSATLARRQHDLARARTDIAEALKRSPDDGSVRLEEGNIAAANGDAAAARTAWQAAARLAPGRPAGRAATAALAQFDPSPSPAKPPAAPSR